MITKYIVPFFYWLEKVLNQPLRIFYVCLALAFMSLVVDGTLWRMWQLHEQIQKIRLDTIKYVAESQKLNLQIKKSHDRNFIESEARRQFDLAQDGELIFMFSDSN